MISTVQIRAFGLSLFLSLLATAAHAAPEVSGLVVADLSDRSFSVIWVANEAVETTVRVYTDAEGLSEITGGLTITSESTDHAPASDIGIVRIRVAELPEDTTVYIQGVSTSVATRELLEHPAAAPFIPVTTALGLDRRNALGEPIANDLVSIEVSRSGTENLAQGTLVLMEIAGAASPLSSFTGEGIEQPDALFDLNRAIDTTTRRSLVQTTETPLRFIALGASRGTARAEATLAAPTGSSSLVRVQEQSLVLDPTLDRDGDGILDDGDGSGLPGDSGCTAGNDIACDDNCPDLQNSDQADGNANGVGDLCDE
jgi:hypothetical protein